MREFLDDVGGTWVASTEERVGDDYKGRYGFRLSPKDGSRDSALNLEDVRWNSSGTAERTLQTMSEGELRRRLRIAQGRGH